MMIRTPAPLFVSARAIVRNAALWRERAGQRAVIITQDGRPVGDAIDWMTANTVAGMGADDDDDPLCDQPPSGAARLTRHGTIAWADPGFAALTGFAAERLAGVRLIDLMALSMRVAAAEAMSRALGEVSQIDRGETAGMAPRAFETRLAGGIPVRIALTARQGGDGAMVAMTPIG